MPLYYGYINAKLLRTHTPETALVLLQAVKDSCANLVLCPPCPACSVQDQVGIHYGWQRTRRPGGRRMEESTGDPDVDVCLGYMRQTHTEMCELFRVARDNITKLHSVFTSGDKERYEEVMNHIMSCVMSIELMIAHYFCSFRKDGEPIVSSLGAAQVGPAGHNGQARLL